MNIADVRDVHACRRSSAARTSSSTSPGRRATSTRCTTRTPTSRSTAARSSRFSRRAGTRTPRRRSSSRRRGSSTAGREYLPVDERAPARAGRPERRQQGGGRVVPPRLRRGLRAALLGAAADEHVRAADARQGRPADVPRHVAAAGVLEGEELLDLRRRDAAARLHLRRRCGRGVPPRRRRATRRRRGLQRRRRAAGVAGRSRGAARRGRRRGNVPARAVPGGAALDRHRRLLRGRLEDPGARSGWEPRVGLREGLARSLAYYREHGASYW